MKIRVRRGSEPADPHFDRKARPGWEWRDGRFPAESYDNLLPGGFGCRPLARDCGAGRGMTVMDLPLYAKV